MLLFNGFKAAYTEASYTCARKMWSNYWDRSKARTMHHYTEVYSYISDATRQGVSKRGTVVGTPTRYHCCTSITFDGKEFAIWLDNLLSE